MRINLRSKLIGLFILLGLVPFLIIGLYSYNRAGSSLQEAAYHHLISICEIKKVNIEMLFKKIGRDIKILGSSGDIHRLFDRLKEYHDKTGVKADGPYNIAAGEYKKIYDDKVVEVLSDYIETYGYYDLFLVCKAHGHMMFSVSREKDLGTNLKFGPYRRSHLAKLWERVVESGEVVVEDFREYPPSNGEPALFIGAPIIREDGNFIGVIGLQLAIETINRVMHIREGLVETTETYMVGKDNLLRSDSYLEPEKYTVKLSFQKPRERRIDTEATRAALNGNKGAKIVLDYRNRRVLSAYTPVDFFGIRWALLAEIDEEDAFAALISLRRALWAAAVIIAAIVILIGFFFARSLSRPILQSIHELNTISSEILAAIHQQAASTREQAVSIQQTTATMEEVNRTGLQVSEKAGEVARTAEATSSTSLSGIKAVEETNETMDTVKEQVELMAENIVMLSEKTRVIGDIIATVNDIAEQSNLLALNAAIEAVGAGEQGKRFSVVAGEIKILADRAKESTVQVRSILGEIQRGINTSVMATEETVKRVETGKSKAEIAAETIKQLTDSTQESVKAFQQIVGGANQQQIGLEQATEAFKNIRSAVEQTSAGITQIEKAVANLNNLSQKLSEIVEKTKITKNKPGK